MTIMRRWTFKFVLVLSVAFWLLAITLFIRSKFRADVITIYTPWHHCIEIFSLDGQLQFEDLSPWPERARFRWTSRPTWMTFSDEDSFDGKFDPLERADFEFADFVPNVSGWRTGKFGLIRCPVVVKCPSSRIEINRSLTNWLNVAHLDARRKMVCRELFMPVWFPVVVGSILPIIFMAKAGTTRLRRRARRRRGLCIQCGYDMRQSPARCPECGCVSPVVPITDRRAANAR